MSLTREQILNIQDIEIKSIDVPGWNDSVYIRKLTRGQQDEYAKRRFGKTEIKNLGANQQVDSDLSLFGHDAWVVAQGICDEDGKRLFTNADVSKLNEKSGEAIGFISLKIVEFSGMREDIEELDKLKN